MIYVVIVTGYEGINKLVWAGTDQNEAAQQVRQLREKLTKLNARRAELESAASGSPYERWKGVHHTLRDEFGDDGFVDWYSKPDNVCVQSYDPEAKAFSCCCGDLSVNPSTLR